MVGIVMEKDQFLCEQAMEFHMGGIFQVPQCNAVSVWSALYCGSQNTINNTFLHSAKL